MVKIGTRRLIFFITLIIMGMIALILTVLINPFAALFYAIEGAIYLYYKMIEYPKLKKKEKDEKKSKSTSNSESESFKKKHVKNRAIELLKKVENINVKISEILPEYLEFLLEIDDKQEKIWVNIEISGNIHQNRESYKEQLSYREIFSYISNSQILYPRGHTIEMIKNLNPQHFIEHYGLVDFTIQELEEISIRNNNEIVCEYYNREGIEFYNYSSVSSIKRILIKIRKKISDYLLKILN